MVTPARCESRTHRRPGVSRLTRKLNGSLRLAPIVATKRKSCTSPIIIRGTARFSRPRDCHFVGRHCEPQVRSSGGSSGIPEGAVWLLRWSAIRAKGFSQRTGDAISGLS